MSFVNVLSQDSDKETLDFASADNTTAANALASGCAAHSPEDPAYLIHTSGTGILLYPDIDRNTYGEGSNIVLDDIKDVDKLTTLPDHALHRNVDKIILGQDRGCMPTYHLREWTGTWKYKVDSNAWTRVLHLGSREGL